MLAIGRNIAIGKGFSTADGEIATNGTQPLTTFVWALFFWLTHGDRVLGVALVLAFGVIVSVATAWAIYAFGQRLLGDRPYAQLLSLFAAALWFASPLAIPHTMNCLETGTYTLFVVLCGHGFVNLLLTPERAVDRKQVLSLGLLLGVTFWARNDAVFLITATCLAYVASGLRESREVLKARFVRTLMFGATSVVVASPWLLYNLVGFGNIMPVSGRAEALTGSLASNVRSVLTSLLEYATLVVPVPEPLQDSVLFAFAGLCLLAVFGRMLHTMYGKSKSHEQLFVCWALGFGVLLAGYYGLFFGARWFVQRYMFPLSPFFALFLGVALFAVRARLPQDWRAIFVSGVTVAVVMACVLVNLRNQLMHRDHPHFQVVRWVEENVPDSVWVGAIQTGALGFFHDRTLNLDGKVNPHAFRAGVEGRRPEYVASTNVQYLVDWAGIATWMQNKPISDNFRVLREDAEENLGVLVRKGHTLYGQR